MNWLSFMKTTIARAGASLTILKCDAGENNTILWNKKHLENEDTSTSVTFDLDVWPWPYFKVKKAYIIRCCLLYCALVPGMMSVNIIVCKTIHSFFVTFDLHLWPSAYVKVTFTLISRCTLCSCTFVPSMKFVGSIKFEIWTIDVIIHSNLIKFKHKSTKGISKRQTEFHLDWTYEGRNPK